MQPPLPLIWRPKTLVKAPSGTYTGTLQRNVLVYRGIFYGSAKRFMAPVEIKNRQDPDQAYACPQVGLPWVTRDEDCLHLNIYAATSERPKPVLVYIHGGSFMRGSNNDLSIQGQRLAAGTDSVVVTVNYRLGVFGFLDFSDIDARFSSNPAVEDLLLALRFIKKNIAAFGGDADNITLMGESAGGSLAALLSTLLSDDTFHKTILSSPVPTAFISKEKSDERTHAFMKTADLSSVDELCEMPAATLVETAAAFCESSKLGFSTFSPAVDGALVTKTPLRMQHEGLVKKRPTLIGVTADEMSFLQLPLVADRWGIRNVLPRQLERESEAFIEKMEALYEEIFGKEHHLTQLYSDLIIRVSTAWYAAETAAKQDVWLYNFAHAGPLVSRTPLKAFHTIDLYYLFDTLPLPMRIPSNRQMVAMIQNDLKQFFHTGRLPWQRATKDLLYAKHYRQPPQFCSMLNPSVLDFWRQSKHYKNRLNPSFDDD